MLKGHLLGFCTNIALCEAVLVDEKAQLHLQNARAIVQDSTVEEIELPVVKMKAQNHLLVEAIHLET